MKEFQIDTLEELDDKWVTNINKAIIGYEKNKQLDANALDYFIQVFCSYFEVKEVAFGGKSLDTSAIRDLSKRVLDPKLKKSNENYSIGMFVEALVVFGSSRNQAIQAVSYWQNISPSKAQKSNKLYRDFNPKQIVDIEMFVLSQRLAIKNLIEATDKQFPVEYTKALIAYDKLVSELSNAEQFMA